MRAEEAKRLADEEEKRRQEEEAERKRQEQAKPSQTLEEMFAKLDAESEYKNKKKCAHTNTIQTRNRKNTPT